MISAQDDAGSDDEEMKRAIELSLQSQQSREEDEATEAARLEEAKALSMQTTSSAASASGVELDMGGASTPSPSVGTPKSSSAPSAGSRRIVMQYRGCAATLPRSSA